MRVSSLALLLMVFVTPAFAQDTEAPCHPVSPTGDVVVTTVTGRTIRGTLLCMTESDVLLTGNGQATRMPLDSVRRIVTPPDPVWDGAVKGAVVPLVLWAVFCRECASEPWLRSVLAYSVIGVSLDALDTNRKTLYRGQQRSVAVAWNLRF